MKRVITSLLCAGMVWGCSKSNSTAPAQKVDTSNLSVVIDSLHTTETNSIWFYYSLYFTSNTGKVCQITGATVQYPKDQRGTQYTQFKKPLTTALSAGQKAVEVIPLDYPTTTGEFILAVSANWTGWSGTISTNRQM